MSEIDRTSAHLILAAIRVLNHRIGRSPTPAEVAELLELPEPTVRLYATQLQDLGAAVLVESAYETHLEIRDHRQVDELQEARSEALAEDLADFDRRKQEESEKMARLFEDGTFASERAKKLEKMDEDLRKATRKPKNPFDD
jgi:DNA-directed RNA polymerase specialized sigma subunit